MDATELGCVLGPRLDAGVSRGDARIFERERERERERTCSPNHPLWCLHAFECDDFLECEYEHDFRSLSRLF